MTERNVDVDRTYGSVVSLSLRPGQAWILYTDDGPGGPCGQSMRTTCPHSTLHVFDDEEQMRAFIASGMVARNDKHRIQYGVVDEWTSPGVFNIITHKKD